MTIVDRTREPKPSLKKTDAVKIVRVPKPGGYVSIKTFNTKSPSLGRDLGFVFASNVRAARKKS